MAWAAQGVGNEISVVDVSPARLEPVLDSTASSGEPTNHLDRNGMITAASPAGQTPP